ncbi:Hpt domain-containing protein [Rheinheimera faecalis]|uniref:Hpt domain-containing protein n=1 Tax=Rheinheimera faecalis TaxID=2901141 RepID=UPI001E528978|nr:Hpt domain-containing protein [Rheinheimera faecalis]
MLFNFSVLEQLIGFSQDAFVHLSPAIAQLIASTPGEIQQLTRSYQQQDSKAIEHSLHKLRGSYATLGATALPELSRPLEMQLQQGLLPCASAFTSYLECLEQTSAALNLWLSQFNYSSDSSLPDVLLYIQYLENNDMQAYSLFQVQRAGWIAYLGPEDFVLMEQDIMTLNFIAAAERLKQRLSTQGKGSD